MGRYAEAVTAIETAIRLNPNLPIRDRIVAGLAFLLNDEPERAIKELERARAEAPNVEDAHAMLTAAYAWAGRTDDARLAAAEAVRLQSQLVCRDLPHSPFSFSQQTGPRQNSCGHEGRRASGMAVWISALNSSDRLTAEEIRRLAFGRTWQGRLENGEPALTQIQPNGKFAFRTTNQIATGVPSSPPTCSANRSRQLLLGRPLCGHLYTARNAQAQDDLDYTYVNPVKVFHFSPNQ